MILLISGSTRRGSTNTAVLRTAAALAGADTGADVAATLYDGLAELPAFDPDADREPLPPTVEDLRRRVREAGALLFCTPEYAGDLPGSFKNLLDWTVGDDRPGSMYGKPVGWINAASPAAPTGAADAHASLARVLGYVGAEVVADACDRVPVTRAAVGADGLVGDPEIRARIAAVVRALAAVLTPADAGPSA